MYLRINKISEYIENTFNFEFWSNPDDVGLRERFFVKYKRLITLVIFEIDM